MHFFRDSLLGELETSARLRAGELAADLAAGADLRSVDTEDLVVQLVDGGGRVITSSPNVAGLPVLARPEPDDAQEVAVPVEPGGFLVVTEPVGTADDPRTLVVGVSTEGATESTRAILGLVGIGLPVLLLVVAATTWVVVGRTLAPVEGIRREVAAISGSELHRRVPEPPGDDEIGRLARTMNEMLLSARGCPAATAPVRLRCIPRAAHPGRVDPPACGGGPRLPGSQQPGRTGRHRPGREPSDPAPRVGPAAAGGGGRVVRPGAPAPRRPGRPRVRGGRRSPR